VSAAAIAFYFLVDFLLLGNMRQKIFGTARWGTDRDLRKAGLLGTGGGMIQYSDVQRISPLIRMFILMFSRRFTGGETMATDRKFKIPLLFVLDEFDKLGRMDELHMNMGIHNGFGIHYFLIFQSVNQLNSIYGKDHSFLAHCRNTVFYAPGAGELESAELIAKICGRESISRTNVNYSGGRGQVGYSGKSLSSQDQERSLINADEVIKFTLDRFILICQGLPPYIGKKNVYYEDRIYRARMLPPAFTTREEARRLAAASAAEIGRRRWYGVESGKSAPVKTRKTPTDGTDTDSANFLK